MSEQTPAPEGARIGTVAEETARLVEAFAAWSTSQRGGSAAAAGGHGDRDRHHRDGTRAYAGRPGAADGSGAAGAGSRGRPAGPGPRADGEDRSGDAPEDGPRCESCGAQTGVGRAESCGVCPVCRGISWLRTVHPETIDRLADVAGMLAETLREVAREARPGTGGPEDETADTAPRRGASVQRILVEDDEETDDDMHDTGKRTRQ